MVLNRKSLGLGSAIGAAIALVVVFALLQEVQYVYQENVAFFLFGTVNDISSDVLYIDQTFNQTENKGNRSVKVYIQNSALFWCGKEPSALVCNEVNYDKIPKGAHVCAHALLDRDGSLYGGKIFFNTVCSWKEAP